jgi:hypothetical protein
MSPYSDMVSYPNFLTADETADVEAAYSPGVMSRLRAAQGPARSRQRVSDQQQHRSLVADRVVAVGDEFSGFRDFV